MQTQKKKGNRKMLRVIRKSKNQILLLQKNSLIFFQTVTSSPLQTFKHVIKCSNRKEIVKQMGRWGNVKQKPFKQIQAYSHIFRHIQAYSDISRHNQAYSGIIQLYSEPCVTLAYSELWYIQNPGIFKTRGIFSNLIHPKLWHIQNQRHIQNSGYSRPWDIQNRRHSRNLVKHVR